MPPTNLQQILENSGMNTATKRQRIQAFIDGGGDINALEENGNPSLLNEMTYGTDDTVNLLLDIGADVNVKGRYGTNALMYSAEFTDTLSFETYKKIIDKTADLNAKNSANDTALIIFAGFDSSIGPHNNAIIAQVIKYLIEKGADPNIKSSDEATALYKAIDEKMINNALNIVNAPTLDLNAPQERGRTTYLIMAIKRNVFDVVRALLDRGADPSSLTADGRTSPLLTAVGSDIYQMTNEKRQSLVRLLLDKGADKNVYNNIGHFAYDRADLDEIGEELYSELKPTVMPPPQLRSNRRNTIFNLPPRYNGNNTNRNSNNNTRTTATAYPPSNNNITGLNNNANINVGPEDEDEDFVYPVDRSVANSVLASAPIPKQNSTNVILPVGETLPVYDPIEASDINITREEILGDTENIYFKVDNTYSRLPRTALHNALQGFDAIQFECNREMVFEEDGTPKLSDVKLDNPYYLISSTGKYLVPLGEMIWALSLEFPHIFELSDQVRELAFVSSFRAIQKPYQQGNTTILNYSGRSYDVVGKDHCTAGTSRRVYAMIPVKFIDGPATGGKRKWKRNKKTRKQQKKKEKRIKRKSTRKNKSGSKKH